MAAEEDKKFDAVLGGFLVNDLRVRAGHLHCPESDVLAAYHERSLVPEEMSSWREHIVGCARCQAVVAELEATDSLRLEAFEKESEKEEVLLAKPAKPAAVASSEGDAPPAKVPEKSGATSISRGVRWQWLAPAGALAAGLLIWVAWRENRTSRMQSPAEVKIAKVEPPSPPAPVRSSSTPASPHSDELNKDQLASLYQDQRAPGAIASERPMPAVKSLKQMESGSPGPQLPAGRETAARRDARGDSLAARLPEKKPAQDALAGEAAEAMVVQNADVPAQDQPGQQNRQAQQNSQAPQNQPNAQKAPLPYPQAQLEQTKKETLELSPGLRRAASPPSPAPEPSTPIPAAASSDLRATHGLMAKASNLSSIASPTRNSLWRAGPAGRIEFSSDHGGSWSRQASNVLADLTAGSAPSDKVCWIVGRAGTVLLTTDAGSVWTPVHSPLQDDLGGVRAFDALHAVIWNLGNTKVFETRDAGANWKPVASP